MRKYSIYLLVLFRKYQTLKKNIRDFPGSPEVDSALPLQGARVPSLVGELRSCMPRGTAVKKKRKEKKKGKKNISSLVPLKACFNMHSHAGLHKCLPFEMQM